MRTSSSPKRKDEYLKSNHLKLFNIVYKDLHMTCAAQVMVLLLVLGDPSSHLCTIALQSSAVSQDKCKAEHVLCECLLLDAANAMAT